MNHLTKELERLKKKNPFDAKIKHSDEVRASLEITIPPSDNKYYSVSNGRKILSRDGRAYKNNAAKLMRPVEIQGRLKVDVVLHARDKRRRDLANISKCLFDTLENCGFYADDGAIDDCRIRRGETDERHYVEVTIERIDR